jgi:hypothetical protein
MNIKNIMFYIFFLSHEEIMHVNIKKSVTKKDRLSKCLI